MLYLMLRDGLEWPARFHPSANAAVDDLGLAVLLIQHMPHEHWWPHECKSSKVYLAFRSHKVAQRNKFLF